ncbi:MAG: hypothetical protein D3M94_17435 [Rhodocyclales bacterium GT-UBC]|nr:MAG: hypothetical protein D3M94_17435 [Rhodocyclales bacterium GT-UBC]
MSVQKKTATAKPPASAGKAPKKLTPRIAPPLDKAPVAEPVAPVAQPVPATAAATAKVRKPTAAALEPAVAKGQKVLAEALSKAKAATTASVEPAKPVAAVKAEKPAKAVPKAEAVSKVKKPVKADKPVKAKKLKLVRDSYAMPEAEYARIGELKKRLAALGSEVKKSELLRAGVAALVALGDAELKALMGKIERIKTGRPAK